MGMRSAIVAAVVGVAGVSALPAQGAFIYDLRFSDGTTVKEPTANTNYTVQLWGRITGDTNRGNDSWVNGYVSVDSAQVGGGALVGGSGVGITGAALGSHVAAVGATIGAVNNFTVDSVQDWGGAGGAGASVTGWLTWRGGNAPGYVGGAFDAESVAVGSNAQEILLATYTVHVGDVGPGTTEFNVRIQQQLKSGLSTLQGISYYNDSTTPPSGTALQDVSAVTTSGVQFVSAVPEPSMALMIGVGALALAARRRRRIG